MYYNEESDVCIPTEQEDAFAICSWTGRFCCVKRWEYIMGVLTNESSDLSCKNNFNIKEKDCFAGGNYKSKEHRDVVMEILLVDETSSWYFLKRFPNSRLWRQTNIHPYNNTKTAPTITIGNDSNDLSRLDRKQRQRHKLIEKGKVICPEEDDDLSGILNITKV